MKKNKKNNTPFYLLASGGVLLFAAALILLSQNSVNVTTPEPASLADDSHEEETYPEIPRVSIEEAKAVLDGGTAVFLDVRDADSYAASHIPGAINIPTGELSSRLGELDKSEWIITYCT